MSPQYQQYESADSDSTNSGSSSDDDQITLQMAPYTTIRGVPTNLFGTESPYGETAGLVWDDVELIDGAVYQNDDNGKWRIFSWQNVAGRPISAFLDGDTEFTADRAQQFMRQTYGSNDIDYSLVIARVPDQYDESGEVIQESSAVMVDDGEMVSIDSDTVSLPQSLVWHGVSSNNEGELGTPSAGSKTTVKYLSQNGHDAILDEFDKVNGRWLSNTTGTSFLRSDLEGRQLEYFMVKRPSDSSEYMFHHPIIRDVKLDEEIRIKNSGGGDSDTPPESPPDSSSVEDSETPEPVAEFQSQASGLDLDEGSAMNLLEDLINSDNNLTAQVVSEYGGKQAIVNEVLHS